MIGTFNIVLVLASALVAMCLPAALFGADRTSESDDLDEVVAVLTAGIDQWRDSVDFCCHFTYRQGWCSSKDAALSGLWGSRVNRPGDERRATGVYHKMGDCIRLSWDYGRPADRTPSSGGRGVIATNTSFDEVSVGPLCLAYDKAYTAGPHFVRVELRREAPDFAYRAGAGDSAAKVTPFAVGGGRDGSLLRTFRPKPDEKFERKVTRDDDEHLTVTMVCTLQGEQADSMVACRLTFWTKPSPPVIERIEHVIKSEGSRPIESTIELSEFIQCGGGMMARCVRAAGSGSTPQVGGTEPDRLILIKEWTSDDLGKRAPTAEDFVFTVPPDVKVKGLRSPPTTGAGFRLDLSTLTVEDLAPISIPEDASQALDGGSRTWLTIVGFLASVVMLCAIAALVWRRRKTPGAR